MCSLQTEREGQGPQGKSASSVSYFSLETSLTIVQHQGKVDALLSGQVPELLRKKTNAERMQTRKFTRRCHNQVQVEPVRYAPL